LRKRKSVNERKEEVYSAITQIIAEKGLSEVSTTEVAKKLGVTQPAIYKYFSSKDEMIVYYLDYLEQQLKEILNKAKEKRSEEEKLRTIYREYLAFIERTRIIPRIIFSDVIYLGNNHKRERLKKIIDSFEGDIKEIIKTGIKNGVIKKLEPELLLRFFIGCILSAVLDWMLCNMSYSLSNRADRLFSTFKKGFFL